MLHPSTTSELLLQQAVDLLTEIRDLLRGSEASPSTPPTPPADDVPSPSRPAAPGKPARRRTTKV